MDQLQNNGITNSNDTVPTMPSEFANLLDEEINLAGGEWQEDEAFQGAVGRTMYDTPASKDNTVTILLPTEEIRRVPSQSLVRIKSRPINKGGDGRQYIAAVVEGPFAEPDGLRADAPLVVTTTVRGATFTPRYHGRIQAEILGEEVDGVLEPPRFRPLPNSPAFVLGESETATALGLGGDIRLGKAVGFEEMVMAFSSKRKSVLPRHVGVLGTTGGGKSTTVSNLIHKLQKAGIATVILDTEGEYTEIGLPTQDESMKKLLKRQDRPPEGVQDVRAYHLIDCETTASVPTPIQSFKLEFSSLSQYAVAEILDLSEAQADRFGKAYDATKLILRDLGIYPRKGDQQEEKASLTLDEFESGYPRMTLSHLIDVCGFFLDSIQHAGTKPKADSTTDSRVGFEPFNDAFKDSVARRCIHQRVAQLPTNNEVSWKALLGKLWRLHKLKIFDNDKARAVPFPELIKPGRVSIIDLSDTDSTLVNNLVIANILRGVQLQQEVAYKKAEEEGKPPTPVIVIIEEAHEFLSKDKITKMRNVFEQVARIARRGRKRWLGLMFVTQLPQHLPDEVLGLINNYVLHKIADVNVISRLKRSLGSVDEGLWNRLPNLAPGQAIVSFAGMTRPLLVAIDPTPCRLRMIE